MLFSTELWDKHRHGLTNRLSGNQPCLVSTSLYFLVPAKSTVTSENWASLTKGKTEKETYIEMVKCFKNYLPKLLDVLCITVVKL